MAIEFKDGKYVDPQTGPVSYTHLEVTLYSIMEDPMTACGCF